MKSYIKPKAPKLGLRLSLGTKGSQSAKRLASALSEKLGYKVFRTTKTLQKTKQISYGHGVDKIQQYHWFGEHGVTALTYTTDAHVAQEWLNEGNTVIGRKLITASCGKGIVIMEPKTLVQSALVYTLYKKKKREFRVHVFKDQVVRVVEKKLRSDWNGPRESKIRNLANGYVFCGVVCDSEPSGLRELAIAASKVVTSDFRGVDIGYNEKNNELFVIEVNSAPGIQGENVTAYVKSILENK